MSTYTQRHHFLLDVWREEVHPEQVEWRGKVQHLPSGEAYYFRDWSTLIGHLETLLTPRADADNHNL
ncbi:MAG: hypothetical protein IAE79_28975 [Anaerolinea sp.]|nr:hypothetical protein [Anaerolinea sp.]